MHDSIVRSMRRALAFALCLFVISSVTSCATSSDYKRASERPLTEVCDESEVPLDDVRESEACGKELLRLTGEAACAGDDPHGCLVGAAFTYNRRNEGGLLAEGTYERDTSAALDMSEKGCELGSERACVYHGMMIINLDGSRSDKIAAMRRMDQQCRSGMSLVCHVMGLMASAMSDDEAARTQAVEYQKMACENELSDGCLSYAQMLEEGVGVEPSSSEARTYYAKACEFGSTTGCEKIGRPAPVDAGEASVLEEIVIEPNDFLEMTDIACSDGFKHACTLAGIYIDRGIVRSEREDLAFDYYDRGCEKGAMTSCMLIAINHHEGDGTEADTTKAAEYAQRACDAGIERSCELALEYRFRILNKEEAEAKAKACKNGDATACFLAGGAYRHGANFPPSEARAIELNSRGCQLGNASSCTAAGDLLQRGIDGSGDRDATEANELYRRGCKLENSDACRNLGVNLALGKGAAEDAEGAFKFFEKACNLGSSTSCGALASYYYAGLVVERDLAKAEELHRKGCGGGLMNSCRQLASILEEAGTDESSGKAVNLYNYACSNNDGASCNRLGDLYQRLEGADKKKRAYEYYEKACLLEYQEGCANLALATIFGSGVEEDAGKGRSLLSQTCTDYAPACNYLGNLFRDGKGLDRDAEQAADVYARACDAENAPGCSNLAWMKLNDSGVAYKPKESIDLYAKSCDLGNSDACRRAHKELMEGYHVSPQPKRAFELLEKGCDAGDWSACNDMADHLYLGLGVESNASRAREIADDVHEHYVGRCDAGGSVCGFLAHSIAHRHGPTDSRNLKDARAFLAQSCDAGEIWSCKERAEQLATGELYDRDRDRALSELRALCTEEGHMPSCYDLAFFAQHGEDGEIRLGESYEQYSNLCEKGVVSGCIRAGKIVAHGHGVDQNVEVGIEMLEKTCTDNESDGCGAYLSTLYQLDRFDDVQATFDEQAARCSEGYTSSCRFVADLAASGVGTEQDLDRALEFQDRACRISGEGTSCAKAKSLARALPDLKGSREFAASCQAGRASACSTAGLKAEWGLDDGERSFQRAASLYETGCKAGDAESCRLLYFLDEFWRWPARGSLVYTAVDGGCTAKTPQFCESAGIGISSHHWSVGVAAVRTACKTGRSSACLWLATNGEELE